MIKNFFNQPDALVRSLVVLLFLGGLAFAGAYYANTSDSAPTPTPVSNCCGGADQETTIDGEADKEALPASGPCNGNCGYTDCRGNSCQCGNTSWTCSCASSCTRTVCNQAQYSCNSSPDGDGGYTCTNSSCCSQASSS